MPFDKGQVDLSCSDFDKQNEYRFWKLLCHGSLKYRLTCMDKHSITSTHSWLNYNIHILHKPWRKAYTSHEGKHIPAMKESIYQPWRKAYTSHEGKHIPAMKVSIYQPWRKAYTSHEGKHIPAMKESIYQPWRKASTSHEGKHIAAMKESIYHLNLSTHTHTQVLVKLKKRK